jgi:septum formation protein
VERKIILASASANRRTVMGALGIKFEAIAADIDEKAIRDENLAVRAEKIARAKAEKIMREYPEAIIISGDSFGAADGKVFEKPENLDEARQMLRDESGSQGNLYTAFCYIDQQNKIDYSTTVVTSYKLRKFSEEEIDGYVKKFPVLTWSGALFAGHEFGAGMVNQINGSLNAFVYGFPTELVVEYLKKSGIEVHP